MGRCEVVEHGLACALCIACFWSVVSAQSVGEESSDGSVGECVGRRCARYWWTSMWGFAVTLVVLTMDFWGHTKSSSSSKLENVMLTLLLSVLSPIYLVTEMLANAMAGKAMLGNLCDALGHEMVALLYPRRSSSIKIIVGAKVAVNLSPDAHKQVGKISNAFDQVKNVEDFSEAIVIGTPVKNSDKYNVELQDKGKLALLRANVLPSYDRLKILRGNSTLGMLVAAAQAIGYIYAIVVRRVQGLRVSPVEAIGCFLNIVVLMKVILHDFASVSHRPLHLYLTHDEEKRFIGECNKVNSLEWDIGMKYFISSCMGIGSLLAATIYFIINFKQTLNGQCIVPVVFFLVSLILGLIVQICGFDTFPLSVVGMLGMFLAMIMNAIGYVWAIVVSFKYWKEYKFDVQSSHYLSQVLPYIG